LNKNADAEIAYLGATRIKADDRAAWQGLVSLYDKQGSSKLDSYHNVVVQLGKLFADRYAVLENACMSKT